MRTRTENTNSHTFTHLLIGWGIILFSYIFIRAAFAMFGFTSVSMLGVALAVIPYLLAAAFFSTAAYTHSIGYYFFGIFIPSVAEKTVLYFLGAFFYDVSPLNFNSVLEVISSQKPYVNLFPQPSARHIFELSFMGWKYILSSLLFSIVMIFILHFVSKKSASRNKMQRVAYERK